MNWKPISLLSSTLVQLTQTLTLFIRRLLGKTTLTMDTESQEKFIIQGETGLGTPSAGGVWNFIGGVTQGTDYTQRIGRTYIMDSLEFFYTAYPNPSGTSDSADTHRIMIVYDKQSNGSTPATTDLLDSNNFTEFLNQNNRDRFDVLFEKYIDLEAYTYTAGALTSGSPKQHTHKCTIELDELVTCSGTTSGISSISTGALWFFVISAQGSWAATFNSKIKFFDT